MKVPVKFYAHFQSIFIAHSKYVSLSRSISGGHIGYPVCPSRQFYLTLRAVCSSFHTILCKQIKHGYSKKLTRASAFPVFLNRKTLFDTVMKAERFNEVASPDGTDKSSPFQNAKNFLKLLVKCQTVNRANDCFNFKVLFPIFYHVQLSYLFEFRSLIFQDGGSQIK